MEIEVRAIEEGDVEAVIDIYRRCYGDNYPFREFYEPRWIKKGAYSDSITWLVAVRGGRVCGTGAAMLEAGDHDDLVGEFGRLGVHPDFRKMGIGRRVFEALDHEAERYIEFGFGEARTVHSASQKLLESMGFTPVGFEPMKYMLVHRESFVIYAKIYGHGAELRRNRILLIPQIKALATTAITGMGLELDIGVDTYAGRYPSDPELRAEDIDEMHMPRLLRIEFGRVLMPEIFGSLHLNYGFFKIQSKNAHYLIAKRGDNVCGAVGYTQDPIDRKMKIFEMVAEDEFVKGFLLDRVVALGDRNGMLYMEADVSAYSPRMQRTFYDLGFRPIAYMPAMVFQDIERLDVIRFVRLNCDLRLGEMALTDSGRRISDLVMDGIRTPDVRDMVGT